MALSAKAAESSPPTETHLPEKLWVFADAWCCPCLWNAPPAFDTEIKSSPAAPGPRFPSDQNCSAASWMGRAGRSTARAHIAPGRVGRFLPRRRFPWLDTPIRDPIGCGIRAIDGFITCGRGQRVGIFGGSGVGKSTLIGMMARGTSADMTVLGLVGERGREVRDFLEDSLGEEGLRRSVVVVSTSDQSPLLRIRAALTATSVAEYFAAQGKHVLLVVDSLTRFAMAQREIGLATGEPPTAKGYTPSVFSLLARLIERAGHFEQGSITAFYTVLMEGDDQQDPLVDAVRALARWPRRARTASLASQGHYPPISVLDSLSRLMPAVSSPEHLEKARRIRQLLASYSAAEDLIRIGAYQKGSDRVLDQALAVLPAANAFLQQDRKERAPLEENIKSLLSLRG